MARNSSNRGGGPRPVGHAGPRGSKPRPTATKPATRPPPQAGGAPNAGWDAVSTWYDRLVGDEGSDYHREVILPAALRLLQPLSGARVLDVCCGQGVLSRWLAVAGVSEYVGVDASPQLIDAARKRAGPANPSGPPRQRFEVADLTLPGSLAGLGSNFDAAACIMAMHDVPDIEALLRNVAAALKPAGRLLLIGLHPCFRIPRQSSWAWDEQRKIQYRRLDRYASALQIPIATHPGRGSAEQTLFYHRPLQAYTAALAQAGFAIHTLEELLSHRRAAPGGHSRGENRAAEEFPIFLALVARKA